MHPVATNARIGDTACTHCWKLKADVPTRPPFFYAIGGYEVALPYRYPCLTCFSPRPLCSTFPSQNPREFWRGRARRAAGGCPKQGEGAGIDSRGPFPFSSSTASPSSASPSPPTESSLVTNARKSWNAAVIRCSDAIVGTFYGGRKGEGKGDDDAAAS